MSEWKEVIIGNHIDLITGFAFKSIDFKTEKIDGTLPVIKIKNVANGDVNLTDVVYHKFNSNLEKFLIYKDDILVAMTGNHPQAKTQVVGDVSRYKLNEKSLLNQRVGKIIIKDKASLDFIYYLFKNKDVQDYLSSQSSGSANQANISKSDILGLKLIIPLLPEQKAIASVLSSLDDKIDLLHRQNTTLEAMAETLFRQYFIEEAWNGIISEYISIQGGYAFKSKDFKERGYAGVIKIRNISMGMIDIVNTDFVDKEVVQNIDKKFQLKSGDFLIAMTGAEIGKIGVIEKTEKEIWVNQRVGKLISKVPYGDLIGYLALKSKEGQEHILNTCAGSAQENISSSGIEEMNFVKYETKRTSELGKELQPLFHKIVFNQNQIRIISTLRDTLLPKLMSGEVRVEI